MAPGDRQAAVTAYEAFTRELEAIERPQGEAFGEPDAICVPVPFDEKSQ